jgi:hypothetical protein
MYENCKKWSRVARWNIFKPNIPNWVKTWEDLGMDKIGIFYDQFEYRYVYYGHYVYFMDI